MANLNVNAGVNNMAYGDEIGQARFVWTDQLRNDLLTCYEESSPGRRGYMRRLHDKWSIAHPEYRDKTQQHLRECALYLRRIGWVVVHPAAQPAEEEEGPVPPEVAPLPQIPQQDIDFRTRRRNIKHKVRLTPEDLARVNGELDNSLGEDSDLWDINCAVYNAAVSLLPRRQRPNRAAEEKARMQMYRLEAKISKTRKRASRIQCVMDYMTSGRPYTAKVRRFVRDLKRQVRTLNMAVLVVEKQHCLERLRALMAAKKTLRKRAVGIEENNLFASNPSRLFQGPQTVVENPPSAQQVHDFWRAIYENPSPFNENTPAVDRFVDFCEQHLPPEGEVCRPIDREEVSRAVAGVKNHSAPGPDGITNFWWKKFTSVHRHLARIFSSWLMDGEPIPGWLVEGRTVLVPKKGDLSDPKNYRPITCLNTCYKIFTAILNQRILRAIDPVWKRIYEQRGSKRGVTGCQENLLIDRCVTQDSRQHGRNLSMAWIDYRKAFDTTSHELLLHMLDYLGVSHNIVRCIQHLIPCWKTRFTIRSGNRVISTEPVIYRRGVFQGDSLSPLLFCISLLPLSVSLRDMRGYSCGPPANRVHKITHLFYMDDLKLYASSWRDLEQSLKVVQEYSRDIGMELGLDKCAFLHLHRGRVEELDNDIELIDGNMMRQLHAGETYQYLGVAQSDIQDAGNVKKSLCDRYKQLLKKIWSSQLSGKNKVTATNILAVPIVNYSFGAVRWNRLELRDLDVVTRKVMTLYRSHHPHASSTRIYLPRDQGGRGLLSLKCLYNRAVLGMASAVLKSSNDPLLSLVHAHEMRGEGAFLYKAAGTAAEILGLDFTTDPLSSDDADVGNITDMSISRLRQVVKKAEVGSIYAHIVEQPVHGLFYRNCGDLRLSKDLTFGFLRSAGLKSETEGFIIACQDGVMKTRNYMRHVMRDLTVLDVCRVCNVPGQRETLMHLLSACRSLAQTTYVYRHNAALRVLYYHLRHSYGIDAIPMLPWVPGDIEAVVRNEKCVIYWNFSFHGTRQLTANKPDIVLRDLEKKVIYVIEFSAPCETNIVSKEDDKRTKYQELLLELRHIYPDYSVKMVVLIIGVLGGMRDTFLRDLKIIPACRDRARDLACRMQKAVILGSLRLIRSLDLNGA